MLSNPQMQKWLPVQVGRVVRRSFDPVMVTGFAVILSELKKDIQALRNIPSNEVPRNLNPASIPP
jgi:hypothetical protein